MTKKHSIKRSVPSAFFYNGLSTSLSSVALRLSSMAFSVYLAGMAGASAMGLMSLIYSVWGFVLTVGCLSGGFCCARVCASEISLGGDVYKSTSMCIKFCSLFSAFVGVLLFLLSDFAGECLLGDTRCILPLKILSLSLPFISAGGAIEGYFNACTRIYKISFLRITEQLIKIALTALTFYVYGNSSSEQACINIVLGGVISEISSFSILLWLFIRDRKKHFKKGNPPVCTYKKIASLSFPVTASTGIRSALISFEHVLIPKKLNGYGYTYEESLSLFGTIHGMALPIVLFCYSLPASFSSLLVPKIAEYDALNNKKEVAYIMKRAYRTALFFSFAVSGFMLLSSKLFGAVLYPQSDAGKYIRILAPLIPIMYVDSVSDSFLKGLNNQIYSMKINIIDSLISISCIILLTPHLGVWGYIVAIYASEIFNTCASFSRVMRLTGYTIPVFKFILVPLFCSVASAQITSRLYVLKAVSDCASYLLLIMGGILFLISYTSILLITGKISPEEIQWFTAILSPSQKENK